MGPAPAVRLGPLGQLRLGKQGSGGRRVAWRPFLGQQLEACQLSCQVPGRSIKPTGQRITITPLFTSSNCAARSQGESAEFSHSALSSTERHS